MKDPKTGIIYQPQLETNMIKKLDVRRNSKKTLFSKDNSMARRN
jgi:hypothetical protein